MCVQNDPCPEKISESEFVSLNPKNHELPNHLKDFECYNLVKPPIEMKTQNIYHQRIVAIGQYIKFFQPQALVSGYQYNFEPNKDETFLCDMIALENKKFKMSEYYNCLVGFDAWRKRKKKINK